MAWYSSHCEERSDVPVRWSASARKRGNLMRLLHSVRNDTIYGGNYKEREWPLNRLPQKRTEFPSRAKPSSEHHTYLRVGDKVFHKNFKSWGGGIVTETWTSDLPGGFCYVRILFQDGKQRVFDNNFDSTCCCYYTGIALLNRVELL
jgi:hypothetical protein